jgi:IS5 family transposase
MLAIDAVPPSDYLVADKGYDSNALRSWLIERGTTPVIPSKSNRKVPIDHDRQIYRQRRAHVLPLQGLAPRRHPLRSKHQNLHGNHRHRRLRHMVALMSLDPSKTT